MIILLYGEDSFRRKKKYNEIIAEFLLKNSNLGLFEFEAIDILSFLESINNRSIFSPRILVGLKDIDLKDIDKDTKNYLNNILSKIVSDTEIIALISSINTTPPEWIINLSKKHQEFSELPKEKLAFFILKESELRNVKLSEDDIKSLISTYNGDLWAIKSELDKLSSVSNFEDMIQKKEEFNYFELLNVFKFAKTREKKIISLEIMLCKLKEDPARIFNSLAYYPPKGINKETWFTIMANYDIAVKSGKMDYEDALLDLAMR